MGISMFKKRTAGFWLPGILLFTFFPLLPLCIAGAAADLAGCRLDEGSVHPCMIAGTDFGSLLYDMGVMGWLMLLTFPVGLLLLSCWLIVFLKKFFAARRGARTD
jgi:hypothetical protein